VGKGEFAASTSVVNVDGARVAYRLHGRGPAVVLVNCAHDQIVTQTPELAASIRGSMCQQISAGHLAYFEGADEFLSLATEFLRRHDA
jgi:hypothetical protein